ncbi:MFS transporter [Micromonospora sp. NBC_01655]|uniref:MFS transporter n=1 Tax=Micromonospora sp. NBC_01655 TaxID=2975983 RepID=UPI002257D6E7|nr:MFS transporter [Micromonospora sp. NBC_01655]MCX4473016.1 MFS transporter [Micromonospora sp. NBC_01655]
MPELEHPVSTGPVSLRPTQPAVDAVQRRTMTVLVIAQIIGTVGVGVAPSIGVRLAGAVTDSEAWAGLARTGSTLGAALVGLPLGNLAARRGRRVALATGWWTAAAGGLLLVAAAQWSMIVPLFAGLLLIGVGLAVSLQSRFAATDLAQPHQKARSLALVVWVGTLGSVLGPNLGAPGEVIGAGTGLTVYASAFLIAAVCLAIAGLIVFVWLRPDPLLFLGPGTPALPADSGDKQPGRIRKVIAELRVNQRGRVAVIAILTAQVVMVAIMTMTPVHIAHEGGSITIIGITISLHIAGMYGPSPLVGMLADRYGHRAAIVAGIGIFLASLLIGAAKPDNTGWIIGSLILLGIGWSFMNVAGSALFSLVVSAETRASSQGGVDALANLCGATAAFLSGPLLAATSFSVLSLLAVVTLIPLIAVLAGRPLTRRTR